MYHFQDNNLNYFNKHGLRKELKSFKIPLGWKTSFWYQKLANSKESKFDSMDLINVANSHLLTENNADQSIPNVASKHESIKMKNIKNYNSLNWQVHFICHKYYNGCAIA